MKEMSDVSRTEVHDQYGNLIFEYSVLGNRVELHPNLEQMKRFVSYHPDTTSKKFIEYDEDE